MTTLVLVVPKLKPYTLDSFLSFKCPFHHQIPSHLNLKYIHDSATSLHLHCYQPGPRYLIPFLDYWIFYLIFLFCPCLLQSILNPLIKAIALKYKPGFITPLLQSLQWLPILLKVIANAFATTYHDLPPTVFLACFTPIVCFWKNQ